MDVLAGILFVEIPPKFAFFTRISYIRIDEEIPEHLSSKKEGWENTLFNNNPIK